MGIGDMRHTETLVVDLERLQRCGQEGVLIIRLMMAANDLALADWGLEHFKQEQPRLQRHAQLGACHYFIRLLCGHLNEAMELVQEVRDTPSLSWLIERCTQPTREAFHRLVECLRGGSQYQQFQQYIGKIRHNVAFHYQPTPVARALADRASQLEARRATITRGTDVSLWRFDLADDILDSIVCRQLWHIPQTADLRTEADRISDYGSSFCQDFFNFCGEFIFRYIREHAVL
jgi:hypothetical protein